MTKITSSSTEKAVATATADTKSLLNRQVAKRAFAQDLWRPQRRGGMKSDVLLGSAFEALQANRLRSLLTMLGVIIGVSAVIAVVTLTQGVNLSVSQRFAAWAPMLLLFPPVQRRLLVRAALPDQNRRSPGAMPRRLPRLPI